MFQSPDGDSFSPKRQVFAAPATSQPTFQSPDGDSFSPKKVRKETPMATSNSFQSPDGDSFSPKIFTNGSETDKDGYVSVP